MTPMVTTPKGSLTRRQRARDRTEGARARAPGDTKKRASGACGEGRGFRCILGVVAKTRQGGDVVFFVCGEEDHRIR